ncbi:hypothetical protein J2847_005266 [Azospirillum agricola]|uniref:hypothetical protein n=1 Tax=Azospirillum agricola TaxID=1720247 RepID=UPI001AE3C135|nr:hypothetical protein [Azospirillum agricola]MBP2231943.1 hypothetical protein [Azospirillum agricola]
MPAGPFRLDLYQFLQNHAAAIVEDSGRRAADLAIPEDWEGRFGLSASNSSHPGPLRRAVIDAIAAGSRDLVPLVRVGDAIRRVVKSVYGDEYDAAVVNSAEAGLWVSYETLIAPSLVGRGDPSRVKAVVPYERHIEHHASYGRPVPGFYKDLFADRGATAGELGLLGRRQENVDVALVKLPGARYDVHGIKSYPAPLLLEVDAEAAALALGAAADRHAAELGGFVSLAYDTPGFGYGTRFADGTAVLHRRIGELAARFGVPYIADNAWGVPFLGTDIRRIGADVMLFSLDKVAGGPSAGLIVGREGPMVNIRRALGIHGERFGTVSSHGKGSHVAVDPGKEALHGTLAALRTLRDAPETILAPIEQTHAIVLDEFERARGRLWDGIAIAASANLGGVEINYQRTWAPASRGDRPWGIPIFTHEDRIARSNLFNQALARAGVLPNLSDDANILITPGAGTLDGEGRLIEDRMRLAVRAVFHTLILLQDWTERAARETGQDRG